jgi:hypothetical protein
MATESTRNIRADYDEVVETLRKAHELIINLRGNHSILDIAEMEWSCIERGDTIANAGFHLDFEVTRLSKTLASTHGLIAARNNFRRKSKRLNTQSCVRTRPTAP